VLVGVAVVAGVVLLAAQLRRVGLLFEERVWWRYARDVPYYSSILFQWSTIPADCIKLNE
jgi:hypothetical protein